MKEAVMAVALAASLGAGSADATSSTDVLRVPVGAAISSTARAAIEACLGEPVTFIGEAVLVVHRMDLPDGGRLLVVHRNPLGVVALGVSTGTTYRPLGSDTLVQVLAPSGAFSYTFNGTLRVTGPQGPRFDGRILAHVTVTPTGELTAQVEVFEIDCLP